MTQKKAKKNSNDPVVRELDMIKRLLILQLMKAGTPQGEIAKALSVDQAALSRMMPARGYKRFPWLPVEEKKGKTAKKKGTVRKG